MEIPSKQLKSGFNLPVYGIGTWKMGGGWKADHSKDSQEIAAIQAALDRGVSHIDTAEIYGLGHTEELVGQAIRKYQRSKVFLVSKVEEKNFGYDGVLNACENSLKRLGTDYLDLYLLHWFSSVTPLKETIRGLDRLVREGLVKNIGVSNFGVDHLAEAQSYSTYKIICDQVHYNLQVREPEKKGLLSYCQQNDVFIVAYRPVEKGLIFKKVPEVLRLMAEKYGKTPAQIAINWLISQPLVVTIAKTSKLNHLEENLGALGWQMASVDIEQLRREFPGQRDLSDLVELG